MRVDAFLLFTGVLTGACFGSLLGGGGSILVMLDPATGMLAGLVAGSGLGAFLGVSVEP